MYHFYVPTSSHASASRLWRRQRSRGGGAVLVREVCSLNSNCCQQLPLRNRSVELALARTVGLKIYSDVSVRWLVVGVGLHAHAAAAPWAAPGSPRGVSRVEGMQDDSRSELRPSVCAAQPAGFCWARERCTGTARLERLLLETARSSVTP